MGPDRQRLAAVAAFIGAAVLLGLARSTGRGWLVPVGVALFVLGVGLFLRWRAAGRATVLDREEKTSEEDS